jgi:hypothetical protein
MRSLLLSSLRELLFWICSWATDIKVDNYYLWLSNWYWSIGPDKPAS